MPNGIGSHHRGHEGKNNEWLTPPEIIHALGEFDLDPCSPVNRPWRTAKSHYTTEDDGLTKPWIGRVWLNPPYGPHTGKWLRRLACHGRGTALIFARTETEMFFEHVWGKASALLFIKGRLHFHYVDGTRAAANSGAPSVLISYGDEDAQILRDCGIKGAYIRLEKD